MGMRQEDTLWWWQMQFKTAEELAVMQHANDIASAAHVELLRYAKPGRCFGLAQKITHVAAAQV
jgi:Xaa-Pro aminopeptidase